AIEQKVISNNPRSTVGTTTEIYDYLKLLFARIGKTYSPISGQEVKKHSVTDVVQFIESLPNDERILILSPIPNFNKYGVEEQLKILIQQGYSRIYLDNQLQNIDEVITQIPANCEEAKRVIDRATADTSTEEALGRLGDSVHLALTEGNGSCSILTMSDKKEHVFSTRF